MIFVNLASDKFNNFLQLINNIKLLELLQIKFFHFIGKNANFPIKSGFFFNEEKAQSGLDFS